MLRNWLDVAPDASPATVRDTLRDRVETLCADCFDQVYPYLGRMMSLPLQDEVEDGLRGLDAQSLQFITFRAVETLLERASQQNPLAVVCEDVHWADATTCKTDIGHRSYTITIHHIGHACSVAPFAKPQHRRNDQLWLTHSLPLFLISPSS
jgi:hypothetical protein